jgi:hypothetical protein
MAKALWKAEHAHRREIGGWPAMALPDCTELTLSGEYGDIWQANEGEAKAVVISHDVANAMARKLGDERRWKRGEEAVFRFPLKDVPAWARALKIPSWAPSQEVYANTFSERSDALAAPTPLSPEDGPLFPRKSVLSSN